MAGAATARFGSTRRRVAGQLSHCRCQRRGDRAGRGTRWRTKVAAAVVVAAVVAVGPIWFALEPAPHGAATLSVAVVQAGVVPNPTLRLSDEIAATDQLPPGRFGLVVWGESSVGFDLLTRPDLQRELEAVAGRVGADLLVNVDAATPTGAIRKTAVLLDAHAILGTYQKMRLVPFGEYIPMRPLLGWLDSFTKAAAVNRERGKQIVVMRDGNLSFAPLICFESAFPDMSRTAVDRGAQLLVFQSATTTFQGTWAPDQHASLAAVRAAGIRPARLASDPLGNDRRVRCAGSALALASGCDRYRHC